MESELDAQLNEIDKLYVCEYTNKIMIFPCNNNLLFQKSMFSWSLQICIEK